MTDLYKGKYRISSPRLKGHDYGAPGVYFVTIMTHDRECWLSEIVNSQVELTPAGKIVDECWQAIPSVYPHCRLHDYVVMPNHVHGIIEILTPSESGNVDRDETNQMSRISPQGGSIPVIIRQFKAVCTKRIRKDILPEFAWQERYHDWILRGPEALMRVQRYINLNPVQWDRKYSKLREWAIGILGYDPYV